MKKTDYIVPTIFVVVMLAIFWPRARIHPNIQAAPYIWPSGCENKTYHKGDAISHSCIAESYKFHDAIKYNLSRNDRGSSSQYWYRVGNDLLWIDCIGQCMVYDTEYNVFRVTGPRAIPL